LTEPVGGPLPIVDLPAIDQADIDNGWTAETLAQYRCDRARAFDFTPGNVVTEFKRPKVPMRILGGFSIHFKPHRW
jgi:hypothetical protein